MHSHTNSTVLLRAAPLLLLLASSASLSAARGALRRQRKAVEQVNVIVEGPEGQSLQGALKLSLPGGSSDSNTLANNTKEVLQVAAGVVANHLDRFHNSSIARSAGNASTDNVSAALPKPINYGEYAKKLSKAADHVLSDCLGCIHKQLGDAEAAAAQVERNYTNAVDAAYVTQSNNTLSAGASSNTIASSNASKTHNNTIGGNMSVPAVKGASPRPSRTLPLSLSSLSTSRDPSIQRNQSAGIAKQGDIWDGQNASATEGEKQLLQTSPLDTVTSRGATGTSGNLIGANATEDDRAVNVLRGGEDSEVFSQAKILKAAAPGPASGHMGADHVTAHAATKPGQWKWIKESNSGSVNRRAYLIALKRRKRGRQ